MRGGVKLTEAGRAFLPFAEAVLAAIEDGREAVRATVSEERGAVSLALVGTLADTHIVDVLRQFARRSRASISICRRRRARRSATWCGAARPRWGCAISTMSTPT